MRLRPTPAHKLCKVARRPGLSLAGTHQPRPLGPGNRLGSTARPTGMKWTVRERAGWVVPVMLLAFAAAAGCTDRDSGDSEATADAADAGGEARDEASADAAVADGDGAEGGGEAAVPLAVDTVAVARARDVVRTGTMELTVEDVEATATDVRRLATDAGGFVADEQKRARDGKVDLTVRVPADRFDGVRGAIAEQNAEARDVTADVVDRFADGLRRGWVAAVDGGRIALAVAGFVLPFAVPVALVALGVRRWQRRRPGTAPAD
jgi:Domain of unknown function (DUF4349)